MDDETTEVFRKVSAALEAGVRTMSELSAEIAVLRQIVGLLWEQLPDPSGFAEKVRAVAKNDDAFLYSPRGDREIASIRQQLIALADKIDPPRPGQ